MYTYLCMQTAAMYVVLIFSYNVSFIGVMYGDGHVRKMASIQFVQAVAVIIQEVTPFAIHHSGSEPQPLFPL